MSSGTLRYVDEVERGRREAKEKGVGGGVEVMGEGTMVDRKLEML